mgnify:CR=1 FL=1
MSVRRRIEVVTTTPTSVAAAGAVDAIKTYGGGDSEVRALDGVTVHFNGWTTAGMLFDSTLLKGRPVTLEMTNVIAGWTEGMQLMVEGERTRFWIPQNLAYKGERGKPRGPLVFDIDLIRIESAITTRY